MTLPKVLIADSISQRGVDELARENALQVTVQIGLNERELVKLIPPFSALVVRSQTKVTAEILTAGNKLRVVGRAGVGVDNVDVEAATRRGVVVLNAPLLPLRKNRCRQSQIQLLLVSLTGLVVLMAVGLGVPLPPPHRGSGGQQ